MDAVVSAPVRGWRTGGVSIALATLALAGGCGGDGPPEAVVVLPGAPAEIRDREPLPFCGEEDVQLGGAGTDEDARRCFAERWREGRPAEFISTRRSAEGELITMIFRVLGEERLEVFVDNSRTLYGGRRGWLVRMCRAFDPELLREERCEHPPMPL